MKNATDLDFFDAAVRDAYSWLDDTIAGATWDDCSIALRGVRATLHALRDELTTEQNAHLASKLPTILRGIYFEGWKPGQSAGTGTREGFLDRIAVYLGIPADDLDVEETAETVLAVIQLRLPLESERVRGVLPSELGALWPTQ